MKDVAAQFVTLGDADGAARVVFIHGFMGAPADWAEIADGLGQPSIGIALPGHVHAPIAPPGADFPAVAEALLATLDAAPLAPRPVLVGYSMGGRLALYLALRAPERFSAALIESATPGLADPHARESRATHDDALATEMDALATPETFRDFLEGWYARPPFETLADADRAALVHKRLANAPQGLAAAIRALSVGRQPNLWPELPALQIPALVICGERDLKYRQIAEEMAATSPRIATQVMAGCGHNVHFEHPDAYTKVLQGFIDGVLA